MSPGGAPRGAARAGGELEDWPLNRYRERIGASRSSSGSNPETEGPAACRAFILCVGGSVDAGSRISEGDAPQYGAASSGVDAGWIAYQRRIHSGIGTSRTPRDGKPDRRLTLEQAVASSIARKADGDRQARESETVTGPRVNGRVRQASLKRRTEPPRWTSSESAKRLADLIRGYALAPDSSHEQAGGCPRLISASRP